MQTCVDGYCAEKGEQFSNSCNVIQNSNCSGSDGKCCDEWLSRWSEITADAQTLADAAKIPANSIDCGGSWFTADLKGSDGSSCSAEIGLTNYTPGKRTM